MIKDILVNASASSTGDVAVRFAVSIATAFEAHIAATGFVFDPIPTVATMGRVPAALIKQLREEREKAANDAISRFDRLAAQNGLSADSRIIEATFAGASDFFARTARRFDLSVVAQAEPNRLLPDEVIAESVLFESGRPLVMVPYIHKADLKLDRVMVCWDASRPAARAVADAMPFLKRANMVDVVTVSEAGKTDSVPAADLAHHLARHGLQIDLTPLVNPDTDVANTLLSYAADTSADFMVMGGYGHSRLRQFILGGTTAAILNSMTVPTLLSH